MWQLISEYWPLAWKLAAGFFTLATGLGMRKLYRGVYPVAVKATKATVEADMCREELGLVYHQLGVLRREIKVLKGEPAGNDSSNDSGQQT